jgi:hypothetical protein
LSLPGERICVDEAGHAAVCTLAAEGEVTIDDTGVHHQMECRASVGFGRCPTDPLCRDATGRQTRCIGKVVFATARCADGSVTASKTPDQACLPYGGVSKHF